MKKNVPERFEDFYVSFEDPPRKPFATKDIELVFSHHLDKDIEEWEAKGLICIGMADSAGKGDESGFSERARLYAVSVGATHVLFCGWAARKKLLVRDSDGAFDLPSIAADPPAKMNPKGCYVTRYYFFQRKNTESPRKGKRIK